MLHNTIERKFTDVVSSDEWEVETELGWQDIQSVNQTIPYEVYTVKLSDGTVIECADTHIFIRSDGSEVFAIDSKGADLKTRGGTATVVSVVATGHWETMYDLSVNSTEHTYYTNGVLSHNSTTTGAVVLHYLIFQQHKTVAILANKAATAREILSRVQMMYECLPHWLQVGVVSWNKGSSEFGNGCKILAAATSSSAIRGCVHGTTVLEVKDANTGNEFSISIEELFNSLHPSAPTVAKNNHSLLLKTPTGWSDFASVIRYESESHIKMVLSCGRELRLSKNHPIFTTLGWVNAEDMVSGVEVITIDGPSEILSVEEIEEVGYMYDPAYVQTGGHGRVQYVRNKKTGEVLAVSD